MMTYAAILVHVQADERAQARLRCAVDMARRFDATLLGLTAEMSPPVAPNDGFYALEGGWVEAVHANMQVNERRAKDVFDAATVGLLRPAVWTSAYDKPADAMARASRAADLIVASLALGGRDDGYHDASSARLVIMSGRPVLLVPSGREPLVASRVIVAWKDTREARRALSDALPLLRRAQSVQVLELCHEEETAEALARTDQVARALDRHEVAAFGKVVTAGAVARQILEEAVSFGADLVVAGGYGHSRIGEWMFGGVTRDLISQDDCYILLSH